MLRRYPLALLIFASSLPAQEFHAEIPKAWDDKEVERFEVPLAQRDRSPRYMSSEEYYKLKARPIYRSYPAYAKGMEPAGYLDWLKQQEPEIIFDPAKLHTKEDWIDAGKVVFEAEIQFFPTREQPAAADVSWPLGKNGELFPYRPGNRYIIRKKGVLEAVLTHASTVMSAYCRMGHTSRAHKELSTLPLPRLGSNVCGM